VRILYHHRTQAEDGQAVHIRALQEAWRQDGHEVIEVSLVKRAGEAAGSSSGRSRWSALAHLPRFARELAEYSYTAFARSRLVAAGRTDRPDFLYERYAFGNAAGVQASRRLGIPLVLEVNSPMVLELTRTRGLSFPRSARRIEDFIFRSATRVCAVSGVLRELLIERGVEPSRILVTPNGVHLEQYGRADDPAERSRARRELGLGEGVLALGFVGYYRDWHRLDLAIAALAQLPQAELALVGEGPARAELERAAAELGVTARVRFVPPRPHREIPRLLPAFDIALVPAINPYASPLKLHEYMASSLAVIAPDQPNLREVLTHRQNAWLVAPGDGASLFAALRELAGDPALRERLGRAARATIVERDLTWRGNARRVIRAVEELR
jgi:glycosyltransferase involved in cell wall biosynthesis